MYAFICVPWWFMYVFICMAWYIYCYRIHVCDRSFHTCDWIIQILGPDTHIEYYSVIYSLINIHVRFFIMLNPYPRAWIWIMFSPYLYICTQREILRICNYDILYTYTFISRKRWNLWHDTFIYLYFRDACIHMCGRIIYMYFIFHTHACLCITFSPYRCTYIMSKPTHS